MADLIGNRYRLIRRIGVGGMGEVYAARDERLERDVAVKKLTFFSGTLEQLETFTKRFKREAISMAQFVHPYIVPVYDFGDEDGSLFLVMGLMTGGSLKEKMGDPMPVVQAVKTLLPIASALSYVHENGVIHRDVKPANILFNQRGTPMLADFGIVKLMESEGMTLTAAGTGVGTPAYMAPEQVTNDLDHRIDQYSLGIILYELLTGKKPYKGDTPVMTLIKHRMEPLPDPRKFVPDLSDEVCALLNKTLAKERDERYADMDEFEAALRQIIADESTSSLPNIKNMVEEVAQDLAEEAVEEAVEEEVKDRWADIDEAAETQISAQPEVEPMALPLVAEAEEAPTQLTAEPVAEEPAIEEVPEDEGATQVASQEVVEEDASDFATVDEDATDIASQAVVESGSTELPSTVGKRNLIEMIDGATVFRHDKEQDESFDILDGGPTELLEDAGPTEILGDDDPGYLDDGSTELLDMDGGPTEILGMDDGPTGAIESETELATPIADIATVKPKPSKPKFPIWIIPVALVVVAGLIVGLLAILKVGPFEPEATPKPTYSSYTYENEDEEPQDDPQPEEEVAPEPEIEELCLASWSSNFYLLDQMRYHYGQHYPNVNIRIEEMGADTLTHTLEGNCDIAVYGWLSPEERLLYPDALEFHLGYNAAILFVHREIGIENLSQDELYGIFSGEIRNWAELGGPDLEIIAVAEENSHPWILANWTFMSNQPWREDMVYLDSLEAVGDFVNENWNAIAVNGPYSEPEHILPIGVDGVALNSDTLLGGEYPLEWPLVMVTDGDPDDREGSFIEYIYSDEGWEKIWESHYVPWERDFGESNVPENGKMHIAHTTVVGESIAVLAEVFMSQHTGWSIETADIGGTVAFEALKNGETDIAITAYTSEDTDSDIDQYLEGRTGHPFGYVPAFFWNHQDIDVWGMDWDTYGEILQGNITNWADVGGPDEEIVIVVAEGHISYHVIKYEFFSGEDLPDHIIRVANLDEVVEFIDQNPNAMGIGGLYPGPEFIHWMRINDIEIDENTMRSGEYPLRWTSLLVTDGEPDEIQQAFLDFLYSEEGVQIRWDTGIIPNW